MRKFLVGFDQDNWEGMSTVETVKRIEEVINSTDLIVVNLDRDTFEINEALLLQAAYTNGIPIYGVGNRLTNRLIEQVVSKYFDSLDDVGG